MIDPKPIKATDNEAATVEKPVDHSAAADEQITKLKARALRFGTPLDTDEIKRLERAKRFGLDPNVPSTTDSKAGASQLSAADAEKAKKRADRFGSSKNESASKKPKV